jgi:PAS domain S-box-containing protein
LLWGVAWLLLNPITALREKMLRHAEQPHDLIPVLGARNDEIGALARSFNALMRNLRNTTRSHQESEARLQAIADNIPALVAYVDAGERFHFINQTWINWNGKQRGEVIGRTVREVIGEEAYAVIGPRMKEAMGGRTVTYERDMVESPVPRTVQATWSPDVDAEGRVVGCYVMTHDISELKRTEQRQRVFNNELEQRVHERTAELEASNRELATFAYSVAHDFRTPLRAMDGYSALLQQEHAGQLDTAGQSYLRRIRSASARLATLIDDLLRLAQLTRQELRREKVDLSELAQPIIASLRAADPAREVAISVEPGMSASGDRVLLGSLLKELLGNAWKFSGRRADANIEFGSRGHEGGRAYFVRDNGVGFDMTYTDKLFTPFQRLHGIDDFPGSGVGLALASRIVERHGGSIWPEAVPGEGATFVFVLPD